MKKIIEKTIYIWLYIALIPFKILGALFPSAYLDTRILSIVKSLFKEKQEVNGLMFDTFEEKVFGRGRSFAVNEPNTVNWIDDYVKKDDCFFDIGANIGVFSIYAAKNNLAKVYSFEPESSNYYYLNKNIWHNNLSGRVKAFNLALNDSNIISVLNLSQFIAGSSSHNFDEELNPQQKVFSSPFKQGMIGVSMDELLYSWNGDIEFPNHIKMDVDGNEYRIINGMQKVLKDKRLKTLAIEININLETDNNIQNILLDNGFKRLEEARFTNDKSFKESGIGNLFFVREDK